MMKIHIEQPVAIRQLGQRTNQEDSIRPPETEADESRVFVLCDGMGGHEAGEVASEAVADAVYRELQVADYSDTALRRAVAVSLDRLNEVTAADDGLRRPGTTLTLLWLTQHGAVMAHIGDSRIYHIRPRERRLLYKSRDHSLAYDLFLSGQITFDEMRHYPKSNVITRAMMPQLDTSPEPDITHTADVEPGDIFYLCSDGMLETMTDDELVDIFASQASLSRIADTLTQATADNRDNHTAWLIRIDSVECDDTPADGFTDEQTVPWNAAVIERNARAVAAQPTAAQPSPTPIPKSVVILLIAAALAFCAWLLLHLITN